MLYLSFVAKFSVIDIFVISHVIRVVNMHQSAVIPRFKCYFHKKMQSLLQNMLLNNKCLCCQDKFLEILLIGQEKKCLLSI